MQEFSQSLRELEAERAEFQERLTFYHAKADWLQERVKKGYEGDVEKLWESAQKQNSEATAVKRLELVVISVRLFVPGGRTGQLARINPG